ncbi:ADP-ribosyltransferase [Nocardia sp. NPDC004722]
MEDPLKVVLKDVIARLKGTADHPGFLHASEALAKQIDDLGGSASHLAKSLTEGDSLFAKQILEHGANNVAETPSQLAKMLGIWRRNDPLTWAERRELRKYTGAGYYDLNVALRNGYVTPQHQIRIDTINSALAKLPNYEGVVYRGALLDNEVLARYQLGVVVTEKAFTSTSANESQAFLGNARFNIFSRYGRSVVKYSSSPWEREVLFFSGSKFLVVRRLEDLGTEKVELDMINL